MTEKSLSNTVIVSSRLYHVLLVLYPEEFHCEYGPLMAQVFSDQSHEVARHHGFKGLVGLWLHTCLDLLVTIPKEHYLALQEGRRVRMNTADFDKQLTGSVNLWIKALRCGYNVMQSFEILARQAPEPTASAFRQLIEDLQNGVTMDDAIAGFQKRVPSYYLDMVMAVTMKQRQEGGNLADKLSVVQAEIQAQVRAEDWSEGLEPRLE